MTQLTMYAVRVISTQKYLPRSQRRDGRGGSHLEPVDFSDRSTWPERYAKNMMIRMYTNEADAKKLLAAWLHGKYIAHRGGDAYDEYYEDISIIPTPYRKREEMEVVPITITLP